MDKKTAAVVGGIVAVLLIIGLALYVGTARDGATEVAETLPESNISPSPEPEFQAREPVPDFTEEPASTPEPTPEPVTPEVSDASELVDELAFEDLDLLDEEVVAELLEEYGSYAEIYKRATPEQREELIDLLAFEDEVRDYLAELLVLENDSDIRAYMLNRVDPRGFSDDEFADNPDYVDQELIDLLEMPTETPINSDEWMIRTDLANLIDEEYALRYALNAGDAFPNDTDVNVHASAMTMTVGASIDGVPEREIVRAQEYLRAALSGPDAQRLTGDLKIRSYHALYWSPDRESTLAYFQEQLERETDPRARGVLEGLANRLQERVGNQ